MDRIGDRVARLMKEQGYNQKELAGLVGVTEAAMSRYLNNDREPKIDVVAKMAVVLHTSTDFLISGQDSLTEFEEVYKVVVRSVGSMSDREKYLLIKTLAN